MDLKETKTKFAKFLSGKGFYLVLAGCLVATGVAAWTAYAGLSAPDNEKPDENSGYVAESKPDESWEEAQNETQQKEPYSSENSSDDEEALPPPTVATHFVYPISGSMVRGYSDTELVYSPTFGDMRLHTGLDITGEEGKTVGACGNGKVVSTVHDKLLGTYVEIDHGNGITAKYCGLNENLLVSEGDTVSAGTSLGYIESVPGECEEDPHLHLEFFADGHPIDPVVIIEG